MKNYLVIIFIACSTFVSAQSLEFLHKGELAPDTIVVESNLSTSTCIDVVNLSDKNISLKWEAETALADTAIITFCGFGSCSELPNGYEDGPQNPEILNAGDTMKGEYPSFYFGYNPNNVEGTSYLKFTVSNKSSLSDNATVVFKFVSTSVGISELNKQAVRTFETYPNPANSAVFVKYGLNKESSDVELVLHSLTGSVIKTIPVSVSENTVRIDINDLAQGIYFCSLKVDGVISSSKKIVVTK